MVATVFPLPAADRAGSHPTTELRAEGSTTVLVLRGEWDCSTRGGLAHALSEVIATGGGDVVVDLDEVTFIDAAAVRALAICLVWLDVRGRWLTVRSASAIATRVLDAFGLSDRLEGRLAAGP